MAGEENRALIRRFYMEIDEGNLDAIELVAENYLDHSPPPFPGIGPGREGLKQSFPMFWDATPGGIKSRIKSPKATRSSPGSPPTAYTNKTFPGSRRRPPSQDDRDSDPASKTARLLRNGPAKTPWASCSNLASCRSHSQRRRQPRLLPSRCHQKARIHIPGSPARNSALGGNGIVIVPAHSRW
jgi:hypothetical protein